MKTKVCTKCGEEKGLTEFSKKVASKNGMTNLCKICMKAQKRASYYEANKEKCKAQQKAYRETNKEKRAAYCRANKEKRAAQQKAYYEANKEKCAAYRRANKEKIAVWGKAYREANKEKIAAWREANKEKCAAWGKVWREANKDLTEMRSIIRRANRGDIPSLKIYGLPDRETVKQVRKDKLAIFKKYFRKDKYHLDHMRPLAEAKGDTAELHRRSRFSNLVYIPSTVNLSKNAKPFWEWFATLTDQKLKKCIADQDAYNKKVERELSC